MPRLNPQLSESPARLRLAVMAAVAMFVYGYVARYLPAPGLRIGLLLALAVNLVLFAALIAGLSPLRVAGLRALLVALLAAGLSLPFTYLGWLPPANIAKTVAAAGLGYWLAGAITSPAVIVLVAGLSAVVDIASVVVGPTKALLERAPEAVGYLTVALAWPGRNVAEVYTALGVADLIFFALYVGAARGLGLRSAATVVGVALGIAAAVVAAMRVGAMPALPWMAAAFLAVNADLLFGGGRRTRKSGEEPAARHAQRDTRGSPGARTDAVLPSPDAAAPQARGGRDRAVQR